MDRISWVGDRCVIELGSSNILKGLIPGILIRTTAAAA